MNIVRNVIFEAPGKVEPNSFQKSLENTERILVVYFIFVQIFYSFIHSLCVSFVVSFVMINISSLNFDVINVISHLYSIYT